MDPKKEKFLFNLNDFSEEQPINGEDDEPSFSEEELNQARADSFAMGVTDATNKIRAEQAEREAQALEGINGILNQILAQEDRRQHDKTQDTIRLTLSVVKAMMPELSRKFGEDEVDALIKQVLADRPDEPRLVVVVHDTMLEPLRAKIDSITASQAFAGHVVIIADDNIDPKDCRIEWADGGIEKDFKSLFTQIERALMGGLDTSTPAPQPQAEKTVEPPAPKTEEPAAEKTEQIKNEEPKIKPQDLDEI